ncbi:hypothetical protein KCU65_g8725, partial [Aureobasidium melanogenum]
MSDHNTYLACKRETRYILWWLCHTSNAILQSIPKKNQNNDHESCVNTTGQITTKELIVMAKRVASRLSQKQIPSTIFRLFCSVISARSSAHAMFVKTALHCKDEDMEKSNATHKHFIDCLTEAFEALGGSEWSFDRQTETNELESAEEIEKIIFANAFSALEIHECTDTRSDDEASSEQMPTTKHSQRAAKTKRNQKSKRKKGARTSSMNKSERLDVPLENYRVIDDSESFRADYIMALHSIFREWLSLRDYVQTLWLGAASEDFNIVVAGAVSEMTIAMIKRTSLAVFVEFPAGYDTFESMTHGLPDDRHNNLTLDCDVREAYSVFTYHDLLDFLTDFQKNRTGKPTRRMQATLSTWNPNLDLRKVSSADRVEWRRLYTISWLYELVNVFSHIVIHENKIDISVNALETIQWSVNEPCYRPCRLFGLEEFAETITTLAMQKSGTNIRSKIFPHHVFELQCIVDSWTASCGWSPGLAEDTEQLRALPNGRVPPTESIMQFLGTESAGFLSGSQAVLQYLADNVMAKTRPQSRQQQIYDVLDSLTAQIRGWLGRSDSVFNSGKASIFKRHESNGLWNYSPFLCGVGLLEALEIAYRMSMIVWGQLIPEPFLLLALVQQTHDKESRDLVTCLSRLCSTKEVSSASSRARYAALERRPQKISERADSVAFGASRDISTALKLTDNGMFERMSFLLLYRECEWDPTRILQREESRGSAMEEATSAWDKDGPEADRIREMWAKIPSPAASGMGSLSASAKRVGHSEYGPWGVSQLILGEMDMVRDICSHRPISALDYMWITIKAIAIFDATIERLRLLRNPIYPHIIRSGKTWSSTILLAQVLNAKPGHEECMQIVMEELSKRDMSMAQAIYWGKLDPAHSLYWTNVNDEETEQTQKHARDVPARGPVGDDADAQENSTRLDG